ncbi:hypothetical protein [Streptomyces sp. SAS_270]|uniref:hypothetical protein n=1 Tax=Streptomyces sp. SAS_270 TaxID=3412748 RepID=UPI00403C0913
MTQSGQGEEPSARPAREGIVLPSDGSEPLLPGTTGDRTAPAGGQAWGRPWGPEQPPAPAQQPEQGQPPQHAQQEQGWGTYGAQSYGAPAPTGPETYGAPDAQTYGAPPAQAYDGPPAQAYDGPPAQSYDGPSGPAYGAPAAQTWGASAPPQSAPPAPDWGAQGGSQGGQGGQEWASSGAYGAPQAPLGAGPLPPAVDEGATQYIPPVAAAAPVHEGATQYIPPIPAAGGPDEGATQFLPPVGPGALPPEVPADATQFLGRAPQGGPGSQGAAGSQGGAGPLPPAAHPDAEATQYIAPVPAQSGVAPYGVRPGGPEDRQPPAEFDNLFRSEPEGPASTQQLPRFDPAAPHGAPHGGYGAQAPGGPGAPGGRAAARRGVSGDDGSGDGGGGRGGRSRSRVPLIAAVGIGIAVLGIGAGAMLSGGGGDDSKDDNSKNVSATEPTSESASPSTDPAKAQAVALDKLLADSGGSRASVISAVADVRVCDNLDQAASDLRDAAKQRGELVTRLDALAVDKLPANADLKSALTSAWKASASADNHYAAWADQVDGRKGCHKGKARSTPQTQAGNRASGTASAQKSKAAKLWNSIASTYGLTQRQPTQL